MQTNSAMRAPTPAAAFDVRGAARRLRPWRTRCYRVENRSQSLRPDHLSLAFQAVPDFFAVTSRAAANPFLYLGDLRVLWTCTASLFVRKVRRFGVPVRLPLDY